MTTDNQQAQAQNQAPANTAGAAPASTPVAEQPAQAAAAAPAAASNNQSVLQIPAKSMAKLRADERRKGAEQLAKRLGYASVEAMEAAVAAQKNAPPPAKPAATPAKPKEEPAEAQQPTDKKTLHTIQELNKKLMRLSRTKAREERQRKTLERRLARTEAESALRAIAFRSGIREEHVPFALYQLRQKVAGLNEQQLAKFKEAEYFSGLRGSYPYIFAETPVAPTTGAPTSPSGSLPTGGATPQTPPGTKEVAGKAATQPVNALELSEAAYQDLLRAHGLSL